MPHVSKVPGTKYKLEIKLDVPNDEWELLLKIDGAIEEKLSMKKQSLGAIEEGVAEILEKADLKINPFQMEIMSKELYKQITGDENLEEHNKSMAAHQKKKDMMDDPNFKDSLVSEFRESYDIEEDKPTKKDSKRESTKEVKKDISKEVKDKPEMKNMIDEINQQVNKSSPTSPDRSTGSSNLTKPVDVDPRVSSVDIDDLINEMKETKDALKQDLKRISKRMEKLDNIILKISSMSNRL